METRRRMSSYEYVCNLLEIEPDSWYSRVRVRQNWEEEQGHAETDWGELFFDLNYVAMAFQLGALISHELELVEFTVPQDSRLEHLVLFFFGPYLIMFDAWYGRMIFLARFVAEGAFHKVVDIAEGVSVALMAFGLATTISQYFQPAGFNYLLVVSTAKLANSIIQCAKYMEIVCFGDVGDDAASFARTLLLFELTQLLVICAAVVTSVYRVGELTGILWVTASLTYRLVRVCFSECRQWRASIALGRIEKARFLLVNKRCSFEEYRKRVRRAKSLLDHRPPVPVHVGFTIKRTGEFSMLMLGEGVLQTIILPVIPNHEETQVVGFVLCALVISFVQLINFRYLPYEPDEHAARRSIHRALILVQVTTLYQASLVWLGVGLKEVLKSHYKLAEDAKLRFAWLFCASLSISLFTLVLIKGLNMGIEEMLYVHEENSRARLSHGRIFAWLINLLVPAGIFALPLLKLNGIQLLVVTLVILMAFFLAVKLNVGVAIADAVHGVVYSKDGLLSSIQTLAITLERVRTVIDRLDLPDLNDHQIEKLASSLVAEVADVGHTDSRDGENALQLLKQLLSHRPKAGGRRRRSRTDVESVTSQDSDFTLDGIEEILSIRVEP